MASTTLHEQTAASEVAFCIKMLDEIGNEHGNDYSLALTIREQLNENSIERSLAQILEDRLSSSAMIYALRDRLEGIQKRLSGS